MYLGLDSFSGKSILDDIIERDRVADYQKFLNVANIDCELSVVEEFGRKTIAFKFEEKTIPYPKVVSTGTNSLTLFYGWYLRVIESGVSLLFIDEFDAFYHHELSALVVEKLKETGIQFIITTHNTSIMTNELLRPDCYFILDKNSIKPLSKCTEKELREAHNLEKMYKAQAFNGD
jgi:AAA15 family ATPase/GTPase